MYNRIFHSSFITAKSLNSSNFIMCKLFLLLIVCGFSLCSPHSHKKVGSQETVEHGAFNSRDSHHYKNGIHDNEFDHESVLGSHHAAEEFDHLPPEEAKKRLFSLALKMDTDGDKYVDRKELVNWVLRSFKLLTEEEAMDDFEDRDADEDGIVTWEEHFAETFGLSDDDLDLKQDKSSEELKMLEDDKELFLAADLNGDGMLDKTEYPAYSTPEEFEHMHQVVYQQAMRKRDLNKDGFLSFDEFIANSYDSSAPVPTTKHYAIEKDLFKNEYDLDGDHKLNKEEVLLWLIPNDVETAENEADHLIERSDSDSDGKLSIQEIVDNHDIFVGSEATSFGEQLQNHRSYDEL